MQSTPRYAFPYPEGADTPDMAYWNQQLAAAVEAALTPGPWTAASNLSGNWNFDYVEYREAAGFLVEFRCWFQRATGAGPINVSANGNIANETLCTVPAALAPTGYSAAISTSSTGRVASGQVSTSGEVNLSAVGGGGVDITEGEVLTLAGIWIRN